MFLKTDNPYQFKFLITGIKGPGIKEVYLPPVPDESKILFKNEQKFIRPQPSEQLQGWMDEFEVERENNPNFIHHHQDQINAWEEQEFERCDAGIFFWNDNVITYLTGDHYKYLTHWQPLFGYPSYWEADKEIFYWQKFWEEDTKSYGGALNTGRRNGKSSKMGFWIMNRTSTNFKHLSGMQGEENTKIQAFYNEHVLDPFYKLPYYFKPEYDVTTLQKKGIVFKTPPRRNKKRISSKGKLVLESKMDYRNSPANVYDQAKLHSFVNEEAGKTLECDINQRWNFVKRCLKLGINIIGKAYFGTTVEFMNVVSKGGRAYKKLVYQSDYNYRNANGETISGLYAAMMPSDCCYEGCIDDHGRPLREAARAYIMNDRAGVEDNPSDYAELVRKHPLNWSEVFYVSTEQCEFNAKILQDCVSELTAHPPALRRFDLRWNNDVRFSKINMFDNESSGWLKIAYLPSGEEMEWLNNVATKTIGGKNYYSPKNDLILAAGVDPIDHGFSVDNAQEGNEFVSSRRSRPVLFIKRKYDSSIDGQLNQELLEQRAKEKYPYKTNKYIAMMDVRPNDPNVFFERCLMICWLFGVSINVESQKPGVINWFNQAGCNDFILNKYVPVMRMKKADQVDGTPASTLIIQEYTGALATDIEYFGHTYPFIELPQDLLQFKPSNTREYDYSVAAGNTELACKIKSKTTVHPLLDVTSILRTFDEYGNVTN